MRKFYLIFFCVFIIGIAAGYLAFKFSSDNYTMIRTPDEGNSYGDLIILNTKTGDLYITNESTGYKNFEKKTFKK
ncbi:hypothetical protein [Chryseobacterium aquaticum]|uniref:hypothetical protein n=1 Tax=Chryseobacterium aquaticum TaxID=452084 RepID=UPI002FC79402